VEALGTDDAWTEEERLKAQRVQYTIPLHGTSEEVFDTARRWMKSCAETHTRCRQIQGSSLACPRLPTRVIDVGLHCQDDKELYGVPYCRLHTTSASGEYARFAVLTHCWGGNIKFVTTRKTLGDRGQRIDIGELPQNFQDAIIITRRLGLRYLWIDALCIIQDDEDDWNHEASRMADIFSTATITISALDAAHSEAGILRSKRSIVEVQLTAEYTLRKRLQPLWERRWSGPLARRGWCLQEGMLSRSILHFSDEQVFWECRQCTAPETNPELDLWRLPSSWDVKIPFLGIISDLAAHYARVTHLETMDLGIGWVVWYSAVERFTTRRLTFEKDKFPAIAGIAARFRQLMFDRLNMEVFPTYLAGLWKEDLERGLCWGSTDAMTGMVDNNTRGIFGRSSMDMAPSWSWASIGSGQIHFYSPHWDSFRDDKEAWTFTVLDVNPPNHNTELSGASNESLVRTRQLGTTLVVKGWLAPVRYHQCCGPDPSWNATGTITFGADDDDPGPFEYLQMFDPVLNQRFRGSRHFVGAMLDFDREGTKDCWALLAYGSRHGNRLGFLLLDKQEPGTELEFRRIGICHHIIRDEFKPESVMSETTFTLV